MTYMLSGQFIEHKTETPSFLFSNSPPSNIYTTSNINVNKRNNNLQIGPQKTITYRNGTLLRVWTLRNKQRAERPGYPIKLKRVVANFDARTLMGA
jgi:hypothetical protein